MRHETCLLSFRLFCTDWDCPFPHVCFILAVVANAQFRGIINASKLEACHAEHEGQYCFPHWDCCVSSGTLAIWSSCYQKSQYLHFVAYACPPMFGERVIWYLFLCDYLVCIHKILSANPLMIQRQRCIEVFSLLGLILCYSKLNWLSVFVL